MKDEIALRKTLNSLFLKICLISVVIVFFLWLSTTKNKKDGMNPALKRDSEKLKNDIDNGDFRIRSFPIRP